MDLEKHVRAALDGLPPRFAAALENVAVVVEEENPEEPDLFGWYDGLGPGLDHAGALPDRIVIYRRPLRMRFPIRRTWSARSASRFSTKLVTSSASTRTGLTISATGRE